MSKENNVNTNHDEVRENSHPEEQNATVSDSNDNNFNPTVTCGFCGKPKSEVNHLIKGIGEHYICDSCASSSLELISDNGKVKSEKTIEDESSKTNKDEKDKESVIVRYLRLNRKFRIPVAVAAAIIGSVVAVVSIYYFWFILIPDVWGWGYSPVVWWKAILAPIACLYIGMVPMASLPILKLTQDISS